MGDLVSPQLIFNITLRKLSTTAFITNIYESQDIKMKIKEIINTKYQGQKVTFPLKLITKEIIKLASQKITMLDMPKNLISEIQGALIFFAAKIASWAESVITSLKLDVKYLDKIYWTHLGTIDDAKIFHEYWRKHKSFSAILKSDADDQSFSSMMACKYAVEEIILVHQNAMIKNIQKHLKNIRLPDIKGKVEQIIPTYLCHMYGVGYDMIHRSDIHQKFMKTGKVDIQEVIFMCDGNADAVKYLWNFLTRAEKDWIIIQLAYDNMRKGLYCGAFDFKESGAGRYEIELFKIEGYAEIVRFLLNEMSTEHRNEFFMHTATSLVELFLRVWPYPELCLIMLNDKWICEIITQDHPNIILHKLLCRMVHDLSDMAFVSGSCTYPSVFYEILKKVMSLVSKNDKEVIFFKSSECLMAGIEFPNAIQSFYHIFALHAISIIINDKDLKHKRDLIISMGSNKISKLLKKGALKSVISFMEKILISNDERKKFIKKWDLENHVVVADNVEIREKILAWLKA